MSSSTPENSPALPLRPALRVLETEEPLSPRTASGKVVSIAEPDEKPLSPEENTRIKQFPAGTSSRRLTGRPVMPPTSSSSRLSLISTNSNEDHNLPSEVAVTSHNGDNATNNVHEHHVHQHDKLLSQVSEWLQKEKAKRAARKSMRRSTKLGSHVPPNEQQEDRSALDDHINKSAGDPHILKPRSYSNGSEQSDTSLDGLQRILEDNMGAFGYKTLPSPSLHARSSHLARRKSSGRRLATHASSDTEYQDGDVVVPSCDVVLDNSKTVSYSGGLPESSSSSVTLSTSHRAEKERLAWLTFKGEIVKLAHTLRLKGWRRVPLDRGGDIKVERLSGALTNAVYVVSPPQDLPRDAANSTQKHKPPQKLLLRVYGPQVEHLIDRENELGILRRLARKKIGPRLLGTFVNGRFEEYFESQTLTAKDLRIPDTSKQIAKRMRELHDGIDLLERERQDGPFVWRNWDKWVTRCEIVTKHLDRVALTGNKSYANSKIGGLVCGVEWKVFRETIENYRKWLDGKYKTKGGVNSSLVFAHNDTQYGNILRLVPEPPSSGSAPSPLLLPQNHHKQLVVIDFEYASANTPGLEFANHFTEWCYNYHDASKSWACDVTKYPTPEEQRRFVRSYLNHRPQFNPLASATPQIVAMDGLAKGSISEFLLDSRTPGGAANAAENFYVEEELRRERELDRQVEDILQEIRLWRVANSAMWIAWGIVQAKVPELQTSTNEINGLQNGGLHDHKASENDVDKTSDDQKVDNQLADKESVTTSCASHLIEEKRPEGLKAEALLGGASAIEAEQLDEDEDEFNYLAYAQDRAMFCWGDLVNLGFVEKEKLPERLVQHLKIVEF